MPDLWLWDRTSFALHQGLFSLPFPESVNEYHFWLGQKRYASLTVQKLTKKAPSSLYYIAEYIYESFVTTWHCIYDSFVTRSKKWLDLSITGWKPFPVNHSLTTSRHGIHQSCQIFGINDMKPRRDDGRYQFLLVTRVLLPHQSLQPGPQIFYWIQVRTVTRPLQYWNIVGPEPLHAFLCSMTRCTVLLESEWCTITKDVLGRWQQFRLQYRIDVLVSIDNAI